MLSRYSFKNARASPKKTFARISSHIEAQNKETPRRNKFQSWLNERQICHPNKAHKWQVQKQNKVAASHNNALGFGVSARYTYREREPRNDNKTQSQTQKGDFTVNRAGVLFSLRAPLEGAAAKSGGEGREQHVYSRITVPIYHPQSSSIIYSLSLALPRGLVQFRACPPRPTDTEEFALEQRYPKVTR